jgi:Family of unknown function (DUF5819)
MMPRRIANTFGWCVRAGTLLGLVVHFALTVVFVSPANPIKMEYGSLAIATIGEFFPQNWNLFAPTPVNSTQLLLVRCLSDDEMPMGEDRKLPVDHWQDVSRAHFAQAHRHPISAYERLVRPIQNNLRGYLYGGGPELRDISEACAKGDQDACKVRDETTKPRREAALGKLRRIGSAFCRERYPRRRLSALAIRFREQAAVPWSERHSGTPKSTDYEIGVFPVDNDVTLPGLYDSESP